MARLGNLDIPNYPLMESVEAVKKIYEQLGRGEITNEHIAGVLGLAPRSGGFNVRLFDLKLYGFVEGRGMKIRVTELAVRATFGTPEEITSALDSALKNVPLWKMIFEKWGKSIPAETFYIDLALMAGVERSESKSQADKVRKLYMDEEKYLLTVKATSEKPDSKKDDTGKDSEGARDRSKEVMPEPTQRTATGFVAYLGFPEYFEKPLVIKDQLSLSIAQNLMKAIEDRINKEPKNNPEPKKPEEKLGSDDTGNNS